MSTPPLGSTMRLLRPAPHILAFYDGRVAGIRAWSDAPNWLDDGAYALGACSYAVVDGAEALVYDTHMSVAHAAIIRRVLEDEGVRSIRVVLSHWHADHVAGNAAFADCEIIANAATASLLADNKDALETATPPIRPLILPNRIFEGAMDLTVGTVAITLKQFDIHSRDGTVAILPGTGTLLAGDTLEDPITYVAEPGRLSHHLVELDRLSREGIDRILPNHGDPTVIAAGGYRAELINATRRYLARLVQCRHEQADVDLRSFVHTDFASGLLRFFEPYEAIHRQNVERVSAADCP